MARPLSDDGRCVLCGVLRAVPHVAVCTCLAVVATSNQKAVVEALAVGGACLSNVLTLVAGG